MAPRTALFAGAVLAASSLALAACSTSTPSTQGTTTTTATSAPVTTTTSAPVTTTTSAPVTTTTSAPVTTTSGSGAQNLTVTNAIRSQLVAAGAALNNVPVSEYSGLAPGLTYYALDRATGTYWAAARLVPAPSSDPSKPTQAQIDAQDEGSYTLFTRAPGASWKAYPDGNTGPGTPCPVTVPADVVKVWGWPTGSCRPNSV